MTHEMDLQSPLEKSCQYVKGVGPKRAKLFERLMIRTVYDLLYFPPKRYEDRKTFTPIRRLKAGDLQTVQAKVVTSGVKNTKSRVSLFQIAVQDNSGVLFATWFNQPYLQGRFEEGQTVILSGKVQWYGRDLQMASPEYEILSGDETDLLHTGRIVPIYPLTEGLTQRVVRTIVKHTLDQYLNEVKEFLPAGILQKYGLMGLKDAIHHVHFPDSLEMSEMARRRLSFEEFFIMQIGIELKRKIREKFLKEHIYQNSEKHLETFLKSWSFAPTGAQKRSMKEIIQDLQSGVPMNRLLQGDVGSGKTAVACAALFVAAKNGLQGALMVPTEVLAEQHFRTLTRWFEPHQLNVRLLVGDEKASKKSQVLAGLQNKEIDIVVGTHAILENAVLFQQLGLIVIDEQHKFGVMQRAILREKGIYPDVLVMTATPIPRTLSLTLYGDLEVSILDEMPPGRGQIHTYWIRKKKLEDAYGFVRGEIKKGRQAFIIYPLVEESEKLDLKAATTMFKQLSGGPFKDCRLGLVHGRLKAAEKNEILYQFRDHQIDILVSTTVIEVGIDIPNANIILIENADRFGLAQLHQLRGRIGRGTHVSYCILQADPRTEEGHMRLQTMVDTLDGFKIAEADLNIRGPGEFLGTRQHGIPQLRFGNLISDFQALSLAKAAARETLDKDLRLELPENRFLSGKVQTRFFEHGHLLSVG